MQKAAVFFDRDGTINEEVGYLDSLSKLTLHPGAGEAIRLINETGMRTVVITNQSGVARGFFGEDFVRDVHKRMKEMLSEQGAMLDAFYYCPHHATEGFGHYRQVCACRKPEPGMLIRAAHELDIDLKHSYVVGDHASDVGAAKRVSAKSILVMTGHGITESLKVDLLPDFIAHDILEAVCWILRDMKK